MWLWRFIFKIHKSKIQLYIHPYSIEFNIKVRRGQKSQIDSTIWDDEMENQDSPSRWNWVRVWILLLYIFINNFLDWQNYAVPSDRNQGVHFPHSVRLDEIFSRLNGKRKTLDHVTAFNAQPVSKMLFQSRREPTGYRATVQQLSLPTPPHKNLENLFIYYIYLRKHRRTIFDHEH